MINHIWGDIYIGDDRDAESIKLAKGNNITAFLDLTELHVDLKLDEEAKEQVKDAVEKLWKLLISGHKVLVFCHAGIDRAPFVVAYYLNRVVGQTFQDAYHLVKNHRPQTIEHWVWVSLFAV